MCRLASQALETLMSDIILTFIKPRPENFFCKLKDLFNDCLGVSVQKLIWISLEDFYSTLFRISEEAVIKV